MGSVGNPIPLGLQNLPKSSMGFKFLMVVPKGIVGGFKFQPTPIFDFTGNNYFFSSRGIFKKHIYLTLPPSKPPRFPMTCFNTICFFEGIFLVQNVTVTNVFFFSQNLMAVSGDFSGCLQNEHISFKQLGCSENIEP